MNKINKVNFDFTKDVLKNHIKDLKANKHKELIKMSKRVKQDLPTGIDAMYNVSFELITNLIHTKKFSINDLMNLVVSGVSNYNISSEEIKQDGLKELLIGRITTDILSLIKPQEAKTSYGVETIIKALGTFYDTIKTIKISKGFDYTEIIDDLIFVVLNAKSLMSEFNDLDNEEIGQIAEFVAGELL